MPIVTKQPTRKFTDLDLNFIANPNDGDVSVKTDTAAVKQSIKNLILTKNFEKPFHPEIGCQANNLLFEPASPFLQVTMAESIKRLLSAYEPRANILQVTVNVNEDNHSIDMTILFRIINTFTTDTVNLSVTRTR